MKFPPKTAPFYFVACSFLALTVPTLADVPSSPNASSSTATSSTGISSTTSSVATSSAPISGAPAANATANAATMDASSAPLTFATAPALTNAGLIKRSVLSNGLTLVMQTDRTSPRVSISLLVRASAADETPQTAGWRRLLAEATVRATQQNGATQSFAAINRQAAELGGQLGASVSDDAIEFSVTGESQNANALLDLLLRILRSPRLSEDDVQAARQILTARRDATSDDVTTIATNALGAQLFRDSAGQPLAYGLPTLGTTSSLNSLNAAQLRTLRSRFFQTDHIMVGAAGDLDEVNLRAHLEALSLPGGLPTGTAETPPAFAERAPSKPIVIPQVSIVPGDWVFVSYRLGRADDADAPSLAVLVAALGASPNATLSKRLLLTTSSTRIDKTSPNATPPNAISSATQPLAQQASAALTPRRFGGDLTIFALTGGGTAEQLRQTIVDEAKRLRDAPLGENELNAARRYAIGDWMTSGEALHDRAFRLASDESLGVAQPNVTWPVRLQNVTADNVQRVAAQYLMNETTIIIHATS